MQIKNFILSVLFILLFSICHFNVLSAEISLDEAIHTLCERGGTKDKIIELIGIPKYVMDVVV